MRGTLPIITCDSEDGCDQWVTDNYELGVKEWREIMRGWTYNPYRDRDLAFCPEHTIIIACTGCGTCNYCKTEETS